MNKNVILLSFLILILMNRTAPAIACNSLDEGKINLNPYSEYYIDTTGNLSIEEITKGPLGDEFIPAGEKTLNFGYIRDPIWIRVRYDFALPEVGWILELENSLLQEIDLYCVDHNGMILRHSATGISRGYESRDVPGNTFAWDLSLWPRETVSVYIRIQSITAKSIPLFLWDSEVYFHDNRLLTQILILMVGFALAISVYQFLIGILLKIKENITFSIVIIELVLMVLTTQGVFLSYWPQGRALLYFQLASMQYALFGFTFSRFSRSFSPQDRIFRQVDTGFEILFILLIAFSFMKYSFHALPRLILISIEYFFYLLSAIIKLKRGVRENVFYVVAFLPVTVFMSLRVLVNICVIEDSFFIHNSVMVFFNLSYILFAFAISYRFKNILKRSRENKDLALHRLKSLNEIKDRFLATTAHEIRTPLHAIIGLTDAVRDTEEAMSPENRENLQLASLSASRLSRLVNDILFNAKETIGELRIEKRPLDLRQMTDMVIHNLTPLFDGKRIHVRNVLPIDIPMILGDENRIQQVLFNILGNSLKFTREGEIVISAERQNGYLLCCVRDTGIGVRPERVEEVFEEYEQGSDDVIRQYGGTGLGLSVTRRIIELHGGRIWMESDQGKGTSIFFSLPLSTENGDTVFPKPTIYVRNEETKSLNFDDHVWKENPGGRYRIIAIDDEPVNLRVIRSFLPHDTYQVLCLTSGEDLPPYLEPPLSVDLILLDVIMPDTSGFDICTRIRERYEPYELPVLMLTAASGTGSMVESFRCGANDYIAKPIARNELIMRIESHIRLKESLDIIEVSQKKFDEIHRIITYGFFISNIILGDTARDGSMIQDDMIVYDRHTQDLEYYLRNKNGEVPDSFFEGKALFEELNDLSPDRIGELLSTLSRVVQGDGRSEYREEDINEVISRLLELMAELLVKKREGNGHPAPSIESTGASYGLTAKETEVTRLISRGLSNQEIADELGIALNTVKQHIYSIFNKVGVDNRTHLIYKLIEL